MIGLETICSEGIEGTPSFGGVDVCEQSNVPKTVAKKRAATINHGRPTVTDQSKRDVEPGTPRNGWNIPPRRRLIKAGMKDSLPEFDWKSSHGGHSAALGLCAAFLCHLTRVARESHSIQEPSPRGKLVNARTCRASI